MNQTDVNKPYLGILVGDTLDQWYADRQLEERRHRNELLKLRKRLKVLNDSHKWV